MSQHKKTAQASLEALHRIFTVPEAPDSTLGRIDQEISENLTGFLQSHIVAVEKDLAEIEQDFSEYRVPEHPTFVSDHTTFLLDKLVAQSVHTASPSFIGHMTSALPYFMLPLSKIMMALNQNLVKIETSKAFTPLEREVLGMLHHLVYACDEGFYRQWMHDRYHSLGAFCSGGTIANVTALWAARNRLLAPTNGFKGVAREGLLRALKHYGYEGLAVLVSRRGHYSLGKAADLLGIGRDDFIAIDTDAQHRIKPDALRAECRRLQHVGIKPLAIVGVAGTTETGNVDPLDELADIAQEFDCHFHVDAAWGGPTLFSEHYRPLLKGIERADSVTLDAHKQLYAPMGAGMVVFKDPAALTAVEHHAEYIIRKGSKDLGSHTLEGSRPGMALLVHAGLKIMGRRGYELLIEQGINKAKRFAELIEAHPDFELVSAPELNILTYRYVPARVQQMLREAGPERREAINAILSRLTKRLQKTQRAHGKSFVSRTRLAPPRYQGSIITVFRVVLANPLTTEAILEEILQEQQTLAQAPEAQALLTEIDALAQITV